jgi:hypothetical protein
MGANEDFLIIVGAEAEGEGRGGAVARAAAAVGAGATAGAAHFVPGGIALHLQTQ